jgi:hypothetical protein
VKYIKKEKNSMKKSIKTLIVAGCLLGAAGSAQAFDINIYGASAQYAFFYAVANDILTSPVVGCTFVAPVKADPTGTEAITYGTATTGTGICNNGNTGVGGPTTNLTSGITYRVANKSSRDGIKAVAGTAAASGCSAAGNGTAKFITDYSAPGTTSCLPVTLGASDVAASTFAESNEGCEYGPVLTFDGTNYYCASPDATNKACTYNFDGLSLGSAAQPAECWRNVASDNITGTQNSAQAISIGSNIVAVNPMIDPFAFYVNNSVQVSTCAPGTSTVLSPKAGNLCSTLNNDGNGGNSSCNVYAADGVTVTTEIACNTGNLSNISRIMATQIFSGAVTKWTDFGSAYSSTAGFTNIRDCQRTAGSGTLATLDRSVMFGATWGKALVSIDNATCYPNSGNFPACLKSADNLAQDTSVWFNSSTDDMLHCINTLDNAIGIADADACTPTSPYTTGGSSYASFHPNYATASGSNWVVGGNTYPMPNLCSNLHQIAYDGSMPFRENVRNGNYDFWSKENLYINNTTYPSGTPQNTFWANIGTYLNNPAELTVAKVGESAWYWTSVGEMRFTKSTDIVYPGKALSVANPQNP